MFMDTSYLVKGNILGQLAIGVSEITLGLGK
jgi:hypothetical protein